MCLSAVCLHACGWATPGDGGSAGTGVSLWGRGGSLVLRALCQQRVHMAAPALVQSLFLRGTSVHGPTLLALAVQAALAPGSGLWAPGRSHSGVVRSGAVNAYLLPRQLLWPQPHPRRSNGLRHRCRELAKLLAPFYRNLELCAVFQCAAQSVLPQVSTQTLANCGRWLLGMSVPCLVLPPGNRADCTSVTAGVILLKGPQSSPGHMHERVSVSGPHRVKPASAPLPC